MNDRFNEQISEFIDDEMTIEECDFFVRRLQRDAGGRRQYLRYQLIGAAVRGETPYPVPANLRRRLDAALDAEPSRSRLGGVAAVAGIVAVAGLVAIFGLGALDPGTGPAPRVADIPAAAQRDGTGGEGDGAFPGTRVPVTGIQYLINHSQYASGVNRAFLQSNVIAGHGPVLADVDEDRAIE